MIELKKECESTAVNKLQKITEDIEFSKELNKEFREHKTYKDIQGFKIYVNVLQAGCWPDLLKGSKVEIPGQMLQYTNSFKQFYFAKFPNSERKLSWIMTQGKSDVEFNTFQPNSKIYTLKCSNL